jgi:hypothetical protein
LGKGQDAEELTRVGALIGSPQYLPPDGLVGRPMDRTADVFGLGLVLYEAAAGRRPYRGNNPVEILHSFRRDRPLPPSRTSRHVPPSFDILVANALEMEPAGRYDSASGIVSDLERIDQGLPIVRRRPPAPSTGSLPAAVPTDSTSRAGRPPTGSSRGPPAGPGRNRAALVAIGLVALALLARGPSSRIDEPIRDLRFVAGERTAVVTWSSTVAYRGVVECGRGESNGTVAEELRANSHHRVRVTGLEPGRSYTVTARPPSLSAPRSTGRLETSTLAIDLAEALCDGSFVDLSIRTSLPTTVTVAVRHKERISRLPLAAEAARSHRLRIEGASRSEGFGVRIEATDGCDETVRLDVDQEVDAIARRFVETVRGEDLARFHRKLAELARSGSAGQSEARDAVAARPGAAALRRLAPVVGYLLENRAFPARTRSDVHQCLVMLDTLATYARLMKLDLPSGPRIQLPACLAHGPMPTLPREKTVLLPVTARQWLVPDDSGLANLDENLGKQVRNRTTRTESLFEVDPGEPADAEIALTGQFQPTHVVEMSFNGRGGPWFLTPPGVGEREPFTIWHRIPPGLLKSGSNRLELKVRYVPGTTASPLTVTIVSRAELVLASGHRPPRSGLAVRTVR